MRSYFRLLQNITNTTKATPNLSQIKLADKFQRRIDKDTTHITKATLIEYFSYVLCGGIGMYMVIYHDYGYQDHCFQPLRRWYFKKVNQFWSLSESEKLELEQKKN